MIETILHPERFGTTTNIVPSEFHYLPQNYWQIRCELAEKCLEKSPCDPDITKDQIEAHKEYNDFLKKHGKV